MWRYNDVSMTRTWEHDCMSHEIERVTERSTVDWFRDLDRYQARRKGMIRTIQWLEGEQNLPHRLATTLAWNYFNPVTLPLDIAQEAIEAGAIRDASPVPSVRESDRSARTADEETESRPTQVREGRLRRAAHTVTRKPAGRGRKTSGKKAARRSDNDRGGRGRRRSR